MSDRKPTYVCPKCRATYGSKGKGWCTQWKPSTGQCHGLLVRDVELTEEQLEAMKP